MTSLKFVFGPGVWHQLALEEDCWACRAVRGVIHDVVYAQLGSLAVWLRAWPDALAAIIGPQPEEDVIVRVGAEYVDALHAVVELAAAGVDDPPQAIRDNLWPRSDEQLAPLTRGHTGAVRSLLVLLAAFHGNARREAPASMQPDEPAVQRSLALHDALLRAVNHERLPVGASVPELN